MIFALIFFTVYIGLSLLIAFQAKEKNLSFIESFITSLTHTPIIGLIKVTLSNERKKPAIRYLCKHCGCSTDESFQFCPYCEKDVHGRYKEEYQEKKNRFNFSILLFTTVAGCLSSCLGSQEHKNNCLHESDCYEVLDLHDSMLTGKYNFLWILGSEIMPNLKININKPAGLVIKNNHEAELNNVPFVYRKRKIVWKDKKDSIANHYWDSINGFMNYLEIYAYNWSDTMKTELLNQNGTWKTVINSDTSYRLRIDYNEKFHGVCYGYPKVYCYDNLLILWMDYGDPDSGTNAIVFYKYTPGIKARKRVSGDEGVGFAWIYLLNELAKKDSAK